VKNKSYVLYASIFLVLICIAGAFFIFEIKATWELVKSERSGKKELTQMSSKDIPVRVILAATIAADAAKYAVIDVREKEAFSEGRIKGALNYRLGEILNEESVRHDLIQKTKGKERVFYCHEGDRSLLAAQTIQHEYGGVNFIIEKGYQQFRKNKDNQKIWEGSFNVLPQGNRYKRTPWIKRKNVTVNTLIDLSLNKHEAVERLEGKTFRHAPILLMSNRQIDQLINTLGDEPIVALCNSKVSCFSTRILRYRLEERGLTLAGFVRIKEDVAPPSDNSESKITQ
jgi:rhodanese-related sulfurtransferase